AALPFFSFFLPNSLLLRSLLSYSIFYLFLSFFLQAEDCIRDRNVTGVQTCALPISLIASFWYPANNVPPLTDDPTAYCDVNVPRSEERRVGKEGRSRGST